jgi:hypothetical protein
MYIIRTLASSFARSWGSKWHAVRTWRTMEGLADKGNSPGMEYPKQWLCCRWNADTGEEKIAVIRWLGMLWYWIVGVPLVVMSMVLPQFAVPKLGGWVDTNCCEFGRHEHKNYYTTLANEYPMPRFQYILLFKFISNLSNNYLYPLVEYWVDVFTLKYVWISNLQVSNL